MRTRLLAAAATALVVAAAAPAGAAGVGGIEVTPLSGSSFRLDVPAGKRAQQEFLLRNLRSEPSTVRLYGASATRNGSAWSVAGPGSAGWLELADREITLRGGETRTLAFRVRGGEQQRTGAVVVELGAGTVVQRAATLVYVDTAARVPLPLLLVVAAVALLLAAGAGVAAVARRRAGDG